MSTLILATKLYAPPPRPQLIARPRLTQRLDEGLRSNHKLILISAPPGFGKTTLLSEWLAHLRLAVDNLPLDGKASENHSSQTGHLGVAWVSLDEHDNDPVRFWSYVLTALEQAQPGVGREALMLLHSPQAPPIETILTELINIIITLPHKIVLILDDFHMIEAEPIHQALTFLLDHLPPQSHLVVTSRSDPPLSLVRLRVRNQLTELRESELRFTLDEAVTFFNQAMRLNLSPDDIIALEQRTEGWVAGLQLAALSMQGYADTASFVQDFTGSHRYVLDYLGEEVLARQPEHLQTFLLGSSILERLCGPLCDAVLGLGTGAQGGGLEKFIAPVSLRSRFPTGSQEVLEYLESTNLFLIPLDNERRWYRYHHLFADFLRTHLHQQVSQTEVTALYWRAGRWCADKGFITEAINYTLAAGDADQAAHLIEQVIIARLSDGQAATVIDWLNLLPAEMVHTRPRLSLGLAWTMVITGRWEKVESLIQETERVLSAKESTQWRSDEPTARSMWGEIAAIRAMLMSNQGQAAQAIDLCRQALERLPSDNLIVRSIITQNLGTAYEMAGDLEQAARTLSEARAMAQASESLIMTLSSTDTLAQLEQERGRLQEAIDLYQQALELVRSKTGNQDRPSPMGKWAYLNLAEILREQNELERAKHYLTLGFELDAQLDLGAISSVGLLILARILQAEGDPPGAGEAIQQASRSVPAASPVFTWVRAVQARLWLEQGNLAEAVQWAETWDLPLAEDFDFARYPGEYAILARVYLAQEQFVEAKNLLRRMQTAAEATGRRGRLVEIFILQALALYAQGESEQALIPLAQALALGQTGGYVRIFVDEGAPMVALLRQAQLHDIKPGYAGKLLAAFRAGEEKDPPPSPHPFASSPLLVESLSERELEILRLVATGLSNQEIAARLVIAEGTVKKHLHNVFGKLDARSRTQALLRATELKLL